MSVRARFRLVCLMAISSFAIAGCHMVPGQQLQQSQLRARQLYDQNKSLVAMNAQTEQSLQSIAAEKQRLAEQSATLQRDLNLAQQRLNNLQAERSQLQQRYTSLLNTKSPLSDSTTRRFEELARKYPEFEFDPQTGVSKFHSDILFASGSADIKSSASPLLQDFAKIMNDGDAKRLNILVVGHTDDKPISKAATKQKHPTNWHLSTNRANSVVLELSKAGIQGARMGAAGYGMNQPLVPNTNDEARQKNRRVEIFVLAPDAVVAGWDPHTSRN